MKKEKEVCDDLGISETIASLPHITTLLEMAKIVRFELDKGLEYRHYYYVKLKDIDVPPFLTNADEEIMEDMIEIFKKDPIFKKNDTEEFENFVERYIVSENCSIIWQEELHTFLPKVFDKYIEEI